MPVRPDISDNEHRLLTGLFSAATIMPKERQFSAPDYWQRFKPHLASFGITRIADLTGLDTIGLPIVQACRPLAKSNAVTQGKGADLIAATVSACVEACETFAAETISSQRLWSAPPKDVLDTQTQALYHPLMSDDIWHKWRDRCCDWLWGIDLTTGQSSPVPVAMVMTDFITSSKNRQTPFARTTSGIGAGSNWSEAITQGVFECLERDAESRATWQRGFHDIARIDLSADVPPPLHSLIDQISTANMSLFLWRLPAIANLPAVSCRIFEHDSIAQSLIGDAEGSACAPDFTTAATSAILEAVQARLAMISGAREDLIRSHYAQNNQRKNLARELLWYHHTPANLSWPQDHSITTPPHIIAAESGPFYAVPLLHKPDIPLAICRIVAPQLQTNPAAPPHIGELS